VSTTLGSMYQDWTGSSHAARIAVQYQTLCALLNFKLVKVAGPCMNIMLPAVDRQKMDHKIDP
jgi:hypothetical protein